LGAMLFAVHLILMFRQWLAKKWEGIPVSDPSEAEEREGQP
jgi:hypothetical protein